LVVVVEDVSNRKEKKKANPHRENRNERIATFILPPQHS